MTQEFLNAYISITLTLSLINSFETDVLQYNVHTVNSSSRCSGDYEWNVLELREELLPQYYIHSDVFSNLRSSNIQQFELFQRKALYKYLLLLSLLVCYPSQNNEMFHEYYMHSRYITASHISVFYMEYSVMKWFKIISARFVTPSFKVMFSTQRCS